MDTHSCLPYPVCNVSFVGDERSNGERRSCIEFEGIELQLWDVHTKQFYRENEKFIIGKDIDGSAAMETKADHWERQKQEHDDRRTKSGVRYQCDWWLDGRIQGFGSFNIALRHREMEMTLVAGQRKVVVLNVKKKHYYNQIPDRPKHHPGRTV